MHSYKEIANTLNVRKFMTDFFRLDANTPEEQEYLDMCRRVLH